MPSATYELFARAMAERKPVLCIYGGYRRVVCPIILGHTRGEEKTLAFQIGGELHDGAWRSGASHQQAQTCVEDVDLDVNPQSPYAPRRRV